MARRDLAIDRRGAGVVRVAGVRRIRPATSGRASAWLGRLHHRDGGDPVDRGVGPLALPSADRVGPGGRQPVVGGKGLGRRWVSGRSHRSSPIQPAFRHARASAPRMIRRGFEQRFGEHEVAVQEHDPEARDAREQADEEGDPKGHLTERDKRREQAGIGLNDILEEPDIPAWRVFAGDLVRRGRRWRPADPENRSPRPWSLGGWDLATTRRTSRSRTRRGSWAARGPRW